MEPAFVSSKRLYLDVNGAVVSDTDPAQNTLLVGAGGTLPYAEAVRYGLVEPVPTDPPVVAVEPVPKARAK